MLTLLMILCAQETDEAAYPMARVVEKMQKKIDEGVVERAMGKKVSQAFGRVLARAKPRIDKGEAIEKIAADCIGADADVLQSSEAFKNYVRNESHYAAKLAQEGKTDRDRAKGRQNFRAIGALKKHLFPGMN